MTKITSFDLSPLYRNTVGVDRLFDRIINQLDSATSAATNYPPYDIVKTGDDTYEIRIAAAGFKQGDIDVEFHEGRLTVTGTQQADTRPGIEFLHRGISGRDFCRSFTLADYVEVKEATVADGVLTIQFERYIPETLKPKKIAISYNTTNTVD